MYRARGTLDDGQAFSFTVEGGNFVSANQAALSALDKNLGPATGRVVSFKLALLEPASGEFKIRKADKRTRKIAPEAPAIVVGTAPVPNASTPPRPAQKK
jgi:hypothetical protein